MGIEELVILQTVVGVVQMLVSGRTPTEAETKALIDAEHKLRDALVAKIQADIAAKTGHTGPASGTAADQPQSTENA